MMERRSFIAFLALHLSPLILSFTPTRVTQRRTREIDHGSNSYRTRKAALSAIPPMLTVDKDDTGCCESPMDEISVLPVLGNVSQVSVEYPQHWSRRLFSAMPTTRPYALDNVSLSLEPGTLTLLTGESTAGKSTLLRCLANKLPASTGSVKWQVAGDATSVVPCDNGPLPIPHPVYLDASVDKPKYSYGRHETVATILANTMTPYRGQILRNEAEETALIEKVANLLMDPGELETTTQSWSQSQMYRVRLAEAALESIMCSAKQPGSSHSNTLTSRELSAPILLLDEWLDAETSSVIRNVQKSLERLLTRMGGLAVAVTHVPQRWSDTSFTLTEKNNMSSTTTTKNGTNRVVLSRGRVVRVGTLLDRL